MKQLIIFLFTCNFIFGQSDVPLTLRAQFNGSYGYSIIGNTHNEFDNWQQPSPPCQMSTQSSASLNLLPSQNIVAAYLYWSGIGDGTIGANIQLNGISYSASQINLGYPEPSTSFASYFSTTVNVTNQVINSGNGLYTFSNLDLNQLMPSYCSSAIYHGGWYIVVIYSQSGIQNQQINVYDGFNVVSTYFNNGATPLTINSLNVVDNQNASMTYVAWNGSPNLFFNENILFNNNLLSNISNPPDNPFNGTNSFTGSTTSWNQDIDTYDISQYLSIGDTQANIVFNSVFYRFIQTLITSIRSELSDATVQINQVTGQEICGNRNLLVDYSVSNTNSNATLPANANVSFYADNTFLQTVVTPTPIAVGGSLNLQTIVNIPLNIPDNFTLKIIVDNTSANLSQIAESNETNNEDDLAISLTPTTLIIPTFTQVNPICAGQNLNALPTTSVNGITGSWSPSINNLATTTYTFSPNAGQCATTATMTIVVNQNVVPSFTQVNPICNGQTLNALPTTSTNGISGSWSPSINNLATTTYTFSPNVGQCATTATMTIVVNQNVVPSFTQVNPICAGQNLNALPTTSVNGITGSWSPSINNLATTTYTFSPNAGQCATTATMTVVVNQNVVPSFLEVNPICAGQNLNVLPTTSTNGITGSWSPSINNLATTTYTFSPNAGQCATTATMTIVVNQNVVPDFNDITICSDETNFVLNNQSPNGVNGSWFPSNIDFFNSSNYTFTPNNQCASSQTITITVIQNSFLDFDYTITNSLLNSSSISIVTNGTGNFLYQLDNEGLQSSPIFENVSSGNHAITVFDQNVCENSVSKTIFIVLFPKFFTPNNDGLNDVWTIEESDYFKIKSLRIFDRFGKLITIINSTSKDWNGTYNATNLSSDDYWFTLLYTENGKEREFKSHFSLKR